MPKPVQGYEFTVRGRWDFAFDMLRYDRCWPKGEYDSAKLTPHNRAQMQEYREIKLTGLNEPTNGRWSSFGWEVISFDRVSVNV